MIFATRGIDNAKTKLAWAKNHLDALEREMGIFCNAPESYGISHYEDAANDVYNFTWTLPFVPDRICLIAGDAFYNMRSSLDQLVWALVRINQIPGNVQFPITEDTTSDSRKRLNRQLRGVPPDAIDIIKELQPHHRGASFKSHPLWRLDEICNLDKHRRIAMERSSYQMFFPQKPPIEPTCTSTDNGMTMSLPMAFKSYLEVYECSPITIKFGGDTSGIAEDFAGLIEIYNFVRDNVLPRFESFFL